jgi:hypothetical protein
VPTEAFARQEIKAHQAANMGANGCEHVLAMVTLTQDPLYKSRHATTRRSSTKCLGVFLSYPAHGPEHRFQ